MGRTPCCSKEGLNRGAWTELEDKTLTAYIQVHGEGKWRNLPKRAGLKRCGKSCRLRWLNYLRPDIKRGNISHDEEELIIRLHNLLGNRWSLIAGRLPGRTDNEIKNYWNTTLGKKFKAQACSPTSSETPPTKPQTQVIRTKATRCSSKLVLEPELPAPPEAQAIDNIKKLTLLDQKPCYDQLQDYPPCLKNHQQMDNVDETYHGNEVLGDNHKFFNFGINYQMQANNGESKEIIPDDINKKNLSEDPVQSLQFDEAMFKDYWTTSPCLNYDNAAIHLDSLAFLLDPDEYWPFDS